MSFCILEIRRQIWRSKIRSLLTLGVSAALVLCLGIYLNNIKNTRAALANLAQSIPVTVQVSSVDGTLQNGLEIKAEQADKLLRADIADAVYTSLACGNIEPVNQTEQIRSCDTGITGANSLAAFSGIGASSVQFYEQWDAGCLAGGEPVCILHDAYAKLHRLSLGDQITLPMCVVQYHPNGYTFDFVNADTVELTVVGIYTDFSENTTADLIVPVSWLRKTVENCGLPFYYDSLRCTVREPLELNAFKQEMQELNFEQTNADSPEHRKGKALIIDDQMFIKTAERLQRNLNLFYAAVIPFFVLISVLVAVITFLLSQNRRRELALARSLGSPGLFVAASFFLENFFLILFGCVLATLILIFVLSMTLREILAFDALFLLFACIGLALAQCVLFRFDLMVLLTRVD